MEHHLYDKPLHTTELGDGLALLAYTEAEVPAGADLGFRHVCRTWPDDQEPDGTCTTVPAPRLTNHTVTAGSGGLTIRASIACPDCGLHGYVTDGVWAPI